MAVVAFGAIHKKRNEFVNKLTVDRNKICRNRLQSNSPQMTCRISGANCRILEAKFNGQASCFLQQARQQAVKKGKRLYDKRRMSIFTGELTVGLITTSYFT
jgi:hypothetical protein